MNKSIIAAVASGLLCCAAATAAMAGEPPSTVHRMEVQYGDLDLQSPEGQRSLRQRLAQAARSVCPGGDSRHLGTRLAGKRCIHEAVERAKAGVNEQQLARAAGVKKGRS